MPTDEPGCVQRSHELDHSLDEADRAVRLVSSDPKRALALAESLIHSAADIETGVVARRAAALAEVALGRPEAAKLLLVTASELAGRAGLSHRLSEVRRTLAFTFLQLSDSEGALRAVSQAVDESPDIRSQGASRAQRAMILMRLGRYAEALEESKSALSFLSGSGLVTQEANLHSNLGTLHAYMGEFRQAESELRTALQLHQRQGSELAAVQVVHNLGFVAVRRGDIPAALRHYGESIAAYERLGVPTDRLLIDRCEVLLAARLLPEARLDAEQAIRGFQAGGSFTDLAEARLMLAGVALSQGDVRTAEAESSAAAQAFSEQKRQRWAVLAEYLTWRSRWLDGGDPTHSRSRAETLAKDLDESGWRLQALETRVLVARSALAQGDVATVESSLEGLGSSRKQVTAEEKVRSHYGQALLRLSRGDRAGSLRELQIGLKVARDHQASLGATELRARVATGASDLAGLGLDLAFERGNARSVLLWTERFRAGSLMLPRPLPPKDAEMERRLGELRQLVGDLDSARLEGRSTEELERRLTAAEAGVRLRSLESGGGKRRSEGPPDPASPRHLQAKIGDRLLVELVTHNEVVYAVTCHADGFDLFELGPAKALHRERAVLHLALGRLSYRRSSARSLLAAAQLLRRSAGALDATIFGPLARIMRTLQPTEVVVVPTGDLHGLPWALLASLAGLPTSVVPSAGLWLSRGDCALLPARKRNRRVLLASGPDVVSAPSEVGQLRRLHPKASVLEGSAATVQAVLAAMEGADLAHIVAHGVFRADNALFSALRFHDGLLTVYDLESLAHPPSTVVLSACDAGRAQVHVGDELMGTSAALLAMGTDSIVASVAPLSDPVAGSVMRKLHERLLTGDSPQAALARTQAESSVLSLTDEEVASGTSEAQQALTAAVFVCFGGGPLSSSRHRTAMISA